MPPRKRACAASSSKKKTGNPSYQVDRSRFNSKIEEERYEKYLTVTPVYDKGMDFTGLEHMRELDPIREEIANRGWGTLIEHPEAGNLTMVREFLAHCSTQIQEHVFCRGVQVDMSPNMIRAILQTPSVNMDHDGLERRIKPEEMSPLVCLPTFQYDPRYEAKQITSTCLTFIYKVWFYFIIAKILPTKNGRELTKNRLWLLYCLATGRDLDIADIVHHQIKVSSEVSHRPIYFPNLITMLCKRAGVPELEGDIRVPPSRPMGVHYYNRLLREMPLDGHAMAPEEGPTPRKITQRELGLQQIRNQMELARYMEQSRSETMSRFDRLEQHFGLEQFQLPNHVPMRSMNPFGDINVEQETDEESEDEQVGGDEDDNHMND